MGGTVALANCLKINNTLAALNVHENIIENEGAVAFSRIIRVNKTLETLDLDGNNIDYIGEISLLDALCQNFTLTYFDVSFNENIIQKEIDQVTCWNKIGKISHIHKIKIPWTYRDSIHYIFMILNELPICTDLCWLIISMLRVRYVTSTQWKIDDP